MAFVVWRFGVSVFGDDDLPPSGDAELPGSHRGLQPIHGVYQQKTTGSPRTETELDETHRGKVIQRR